jgi:hypothetical protein
MVNVTLASLAVILAICAIASFFTPIMIPLSPVRRQQVFTHFYQGRFRVFWIESTADPLAISLMSGGPDVRVESYSKWPALPRRMMGVDIPRSEWVPRRIAVGGYKTVSAFGGAWRSPMAIQAFGSYSPASTSFVRMPAWLPCLILLYSPVRAIVRGVRERHRKRHNLCENCGYHLYGLIQPRCPECGLKIAII